MFLSRKIVLSKATTRSVEYNLHLIKSGEIIGDDNFKVKMYESHIVESIDMSDFDSDMSPSRYIIPDENWLPDEIPDTRSRNVRDYCDKLPDVDSNLPNIPAKDDPENLSVVETENELIYKYINLNLSKTTGLNKIVSLSILDFKKYGIDINNSVIHPYPYTEFMSKVGKVLARTQTAGFMDAVRYKFQDKRVSQQSGLGGILLPEESIKNQFNIRLISDLRSYNSKNTSSNNYLNSTGNIQKRYDRAFFVRYIDKLSSPLTKILGLNINDVPLSFDSDTLINYSINPESLVNREAARNTFKNFQRKLIFDWRKLGSKRENFDLLKALKDV
jgi:hypothetical protein